MRLVILSLIIGALTISGMATISAQEIDEDMVAPTPPPRPAQFGGTASDDAETDPGIVIDGTELEEDQPARPDFGGVTEPQPVTLSARISNEGEFIPDGLVWRMFDSRVDANGELAMVAKS